MSAHRIPFMAPPYSSSIRAAATAQKKARVVQEATKLLRTSDRVTAVSLDVVAKAAGVTRLTVYNQFGSRRGLLEAVLDNLASKAGFERIREVMALEDPTQALGELIDVICRAWGYDESIASIHAAASIDPEQGDPGAGAAHGGGRGGSQVRCPRARRCPRRDDELLRLRDAARARAQHGCGVPNDARRVPGGRRHAYRIAAGPRPAR